MVHQVPLLCREQIAQFKRDGFLIIEGCLDPGAVASMRDAMWATLGENVPQMKRGDPSTWLDLPEVNMKPAGEGSADPYFYSKGDAFYIKNGAEELTLDTVVRPLAAVANQLLGEGTVIEPLGSAASGGKTTSGPCFMNDDNVEGLMSHLGDRLGRPLPETMGVQDFEWVDSLELPPTGPIWLTAQGSRGSYVRLPGAALGHSHSDGACYGNMRLQMMAYLDDVKPNGGAFQVWPGSHARIWAQQFRDLHERGETHTRSRRGVTPPEEGAGEPPLGLVGALAHRIIS
jgi:hypothetical protein